jgi:hypothetical protein
MAPVAGGPDVSQEPQGQETPGGGADEWQGEKLRRHREALAARQARQVQAGRLFAGALAATVAAGVVFRLPESWWVPAVGAFALLAVLFRLANWKCPSCGERLSSRRPGSRCLGCGAPLE